MDTRSQITIRTKKLGVLLRDARLASRKTLLPLRLREAFEAPPLLSGGLQGPLSKGL